MTTLDIDSVSSSRGKPSRRFYTGGRTIDSGTIRISSCEGASSPTRGGTISIASDTAKSCTPNVSTTSRGNTALKDASRSLYRSAVRMSSSGVYPVSTIVAASGGRIPTSCDDSDPTVRPTRSTDGMVSCDRGNEIEWNRNDNRDRRGKGADVRLIETRIVDDNFSAWFLGLGSHDSTSLLER